MDKTAQYRTAIIEFFSEIGLEAKPKPGAAGFIESTEIAGGVLFYDPDKALPSNLLHEAGHLAVLPSQYRSWADGDLDETYPLIGDDVFRRYPADHPIMIRAMQSGEAETTAWAWAAGRHLGIPDDIIILDSEYGGEGANIRLHLQLNSYLGINGLRAGGMCSSVRDYPKMTYWLQV